MSEQQHQTTKNMEKEGEEKKIQKKLSKSKLLFEEVMKRCRRMNIKDVKHSVLSSKRIPNVNFEDECWEILVQTSLIVNLDERYEFSGIGYAQMVMPYSRGIVTNYALSSSSKSAEEDAFKKILERLESHSLCSSSSSFCIDITKDILINNEFDITVANSLF
jgi:hypothetical protein